MRTVFFASLALGLFLFASTDRFAAQEPDDAAAKKELKEFQGTWQATAFIIAGVPSPDDKLKDITMTIKGNQFTLRLGKQVSEGTFTLDAKQSPKTIDVDLTTPNGQQSKLQGIYAWQDGQRKSCFGLPNLQRPNDFLPQQGYVILEWKRSNSK